MTEKPGRKIETVSLSFRYGAVARGADRANVLDGISFACEAGRFLAVLGPNGSGKSTLLRLLSGWLRPARNAVFLDGRDLLAYTRREIARRLAVVPQSAAAEAAFTVEETVLMGRAPHLGFLANEGPADRAMVEEALALTDIAHLRRRDVTALSGGELKRVMLAQALAQDTGLLLLDEPTAYLDLSHQHDILALLRKMQRGKGLTVIAALHDLNSAARYADRVIMLAGGKIAAEGAPAEVITRETVKRVYGADVLVLPHPVLGHPVVIEE
jgi:iron complex transport system ATP-binding protein